MNMPSVLPEMYGYRMRPRPLAKPGGLDNVGVSGLPRFPECGNMIYVYAESELAVSHTIVPGLENHECLIRQIIFQQIRNCQKIHISLAFWGKHGNKEVFYFSKQEIIRNAGR